MVGGGNPVALVTGGSRGVGEATARALAARGFDVAITYRNKVARAEKVRDALLALGVRALAVGGNMAEEGAVADLFEQIRGWADGLDLLVLNASGGMERDLLEADPDYPMRLNRDTQVAVLRGAVPLMRRDGTVVFVTSHWAHLYGQVEQLPDYGEVARSKHAGEQALRAEMPALDAVGVRLLVVTGDLIEGTITATLLERRAPGLTEGRRDLTGQLPTTESLGEAIASAAVDASLPSGHTVVVGGDLGSIARLGDTRD